MMHAATLPKKLAKQATCEFLKRIIEEQRFLEQTSSPFKPGQKILVLGSGSINLFQDFANKYSSIFQNCELDILAPAHLADQYSQLIPGKGRVFKQNDEGRLRAEFILNHFQKSSISQNIGITLFNNVYGADYQNVLEPILTMVNKIPFYAFNAQQELLTLNHVDIERHQKATTLHSRLADWWWKKLEESHAS